MVGQVVERVSSFRRLQVAMALVPVAVAMPDCVVLKASVAQGAHHVESPLRRLLRLQLILFHSSFRGKLGSNLPHLEAEARSLSLRQGGNRPPQRSPCHEGSLRDSRQHPESPVKRKDTD